MRCITEPDQIQRVICLVGPTASGKTRLSIAIAQALSKRGQPVHIVNADAYQMYQHMDIGTAKPTVDEQQAVPHHLLDCITPQETMSVARFQQLARNCIEQLQKDGIRPLLVGGSGLYVQAVIDDYSFPGTDPLIRQRLQHYADTHGAHALFDQLIRKDPQAAARMDARNVRRTVRALEVIELTGRAYSAQLPQYSYVIPAVQIGLDISRTILDQRIDQRVEHMREQGFIDEVRSVRHLLGATAARALGYQQIIGYLDGQYSQEEAFALIAQQTKRLARKQMGWFGRDSRIHWLDATGAHVVDEALEIIDRADQQASDGMPVGHDHAARHSQHHLGAITS